MSAWQRRQRNCRLHKNARQQPQGFSTLIVFCEDQLIILVNLAWRNYKPGTPLDVNLDQGFFIKTLDILVGLVGS